MGLTSSRPLYLGHGHTMWWTPSWVGWKSHALRHLNHSNGSPISSFVLSNWPIINHQHQSTILLDPNNSKIHHVHHVHHLHHVEKDGKSPKSPCFPPFICRSIQPGFGTWRLVPARGFGNFGVRPNMKWIYNVGPETIAKLVHTSNNYGLWYL